MTLILRAYRDEDFAAVVDLWTACHLLKPHHDPKREVAFVHGAVNAELFLAFEGERLAGSIQVGHDAHRAWMYRLGVAEDLRRRGIGRALVARAESWALARGLPKLMLLIRDGNEAVAQVKHQDHPVLDRAAGHPARASCDMRGGRREHQCAGEA